MHTEKPQPSAYLLVFFIGLLFCGGDSDPLSFSLFLGGMAVLLTLLHVVLAWLFWPRYY